MGSVVVLRTPEQARAIERLRQSFPQVQPEGRRIRLFVDGADPETAVIKAQKALSELPVDSVSVDRTDLEDAFTALVRHQGLTSPRTEASLEPVARKSRQQNFVGSGIEARELTKTFGKFTAVDRVSFEVAQGEIFGLLGANGAGKTTVIKLLTGIMPASAGDGSIAGADLSHLGRAIKRRIGYMSQQFSLYTDLTVAENILLYGGIYGLKRREARARSEWICTMAGLHGYADERTSNLPVGMRQRLALGCALVHRPRVLFLDEPTSGIDPIGRQRFWEILFQLSREEGVTILVTTHYMGEAEHCDHLVLMHAGQLVADASPDTLKQEVEEEVGRVIEIETPRVNDAIERLTAGGFRNPIMHGRRVHVLSKTSEADTLRISRLLELEPARIRVRRLSMDDVFVHRIRSLEQPASPGPGSADT